MALLGLNSLIATGTNQSLSLSSTGSGVVNVPATLNITRYGNTHFQLGATYDTYLTYGSTGAVYLRTYNGTSYVNRFVIDANGRLTTGLVPWARLEDVPTSLANTVNLTGDQTKTGVLTLQGSGQNRLVLRNTTNGGFVGINFSDMSNGAQNGTIRYAHADGASYGSSAAFFFEGTEPSHSYVFGPGAKVLPSVTNTGEVGNATYTWANGRFTNLTVATTLTLSAAGTATTQAVRADRSISAGNGLTGGGNLTANRTLSVQVVSGGGISSASGGISVDSTVVRTTGNQTIGDTKTFSGTIILNNSGVINALQLGNNNITGVNNIVIADPGVNEGIEWAGGNLWKIYESPNNLTNAGGNLQIVQNTTRRATFNTSGQLEIPVATGTAPLVVASTTRVANLNAATAGNADTVTNGVYTSGNQTIGGTKTFSSAISVPQNNNTTGGGINFNGAGNAFIRGRNQDGASNTLSNLQLQSWFGIGFGPTISNQTVPVGENAFWINVRDGSWASRGAGTVSSTLSLGTQATTTSHAVRADRSISTGDGLSGGGDLTASRTLTVDNTVVRTSSNQIIPGIKTFSGGIIPGSTQGYPNYELLLDFGSDAAGTWRRIVNVVSPNIQFSSIGFKIEITDPKANHATPGSVNSVITETYYVACVRTEATTLGTPNACYVRGPGNRIRATRTATGVYEIHIQNEAQNREYRVNISVYAVNGVHAVSYQPGPANAGTAQYNASVSTTSAAVFQNISARSLILTTQATTTSQAVRADRSITINGTTNQITSSAGAQNLTANRTWTLSLPQNIHTAATPTFAGGTFNGTVETSLNASGTLNGEVLLQRIRSNAGNSVFLDIKSRRHTTGSGWTGVGFRLQHQVDSTQMGFIEFNSIDNSRNLVLGTGGSPRLLITDTGNVGIGTSSPSASLHVEGNAFFGSITDNTTDTKKITVESRGFAALDLLGDRSNVNGEPGGSSILLSQDGGLVAALIGICQGANQNGRGGTYTGTTTNSVYLGHLHDSSLHLGTNSQVRFTINGAGNATFTGTVNAPTFNATSINAGGFQGIDTDTVTTPSFTWSGNLTTGIYRPGTNQVGITTNGTQAALWDANNNYRLIGSMGVGTAGISNANIIMNAANTFTQNGARRGISLTLTTSDQNLTANREQIGALVIATSNQTTLFDSVNSVNRALTLRGAYAQAFNGTGNNANSVATTAIGSTGLARNRGRQTVANVYGLQGIVDNAGPLQVPDGVPQINNARTADLSLRIRTGTTANAYGVYNYVRNGGTSGDNGTITNGYGMYALMQNSHGTYTRAFGVRTDFSGTIGQKIGYLTIGGANLDFAAQSTQNITIGHWNTNGTATARLTIDTNGNSTFGGNATFSGSIISNVGIGSWVNAMRNPALGGTTNVGSSAQTLARGRVADGYFGLSVNSNQMVWNFITTANFDASTNTSVSCLRTDTSGNITANGRLSLGTQATTTSHAVRADRSISTGDGLSGGGNLTANRTLTVDSTVVRTTGNQTIGGTKTFDSTTNFTATTQLLLKAGTASNVTTIVRNDGADFYFLLSSASTTPNGTWNALRPFKINLSTGLLSSDNGQLFSGRSIFSGTSQANGVNGLGVYNTSTWSGMSIVGSSSKMLGMHYGGGVNELRFGRYAKPTSNSTGGGWESNPIVFNIDNGNATFTGTITAQGVPLGRGGEEISSNTAVGSGALAANTTGSANTATGFCALRSNTTGFSNTAFGSSALRSNTTGSSNTATGVNALFSNTTGCLNTATGHSALICNTTGGCNIATGNNALRSNTGGSSNTATGVNALLSNTTGNCNTATGRDALRNNTTGCFNTASGTFALFCNTTGGGNTASGFEALLCNTTGGGNTALGRASGCLITTGNSNTIIGSYTGNSAELDISTSNNNVILSDGAGTISLRGVGTAIEIKAPTTTSAATQIPVFTSSPADTLSRIRTRTPAQLRSDIGAFPNTGGVITGSVTARSATNRDGMRIVGRAGGTGNFRVNLVPTTLTSNRNATFPNAGGTVAFTGSSDYRMKENITLSENAISRLNTLKVYRFNFKEEHILEEGLPTGLVDGFIAHELQEQMPEVVLGTKDQVDENGTPVYQSIDHAKMVPLLTASLQEALSEIELLKTRLTNAGL